MPTNSPERIRVVVVEDHQQFRDFLRTELVKDTRFREVFTFRSGEEFLSHFSDEDLPDLFFLDIHLPHIGGLDLLKIIKSKKPDAKIIILSNIDSDEKIFEMIKFGALGYIYKMDAGNLRSMYDVVLAGGAFFSPTVALRIATSPHRVQVETENPSIIMTDREKQILDLVIECKKDSQIADILKISHSTVRFHIKNICAKLEAKTKLEITKKAKERGFA